MRKNLRDEFKAMTIVELLKKTESFRKDIFDLRMSKFSSPIKNVHLVRQIKKELACALTFLKLKNMQVENEKK